MKNEKLNVLLKRMQYDIITLDFTIFLGLITVLSSSTKAQYPERYNAPGLFRIKPASGLVWRNDGPFEEFSPNFSLYNFTQSTREVDEPVSESTPPAQGKMPQISRRRESSQIYHSRPRQFSTLPILSSFTPAPATYVKRRNSQQETNSDSQKNYENLYSSQINSKIVNGDPKDNEKEEQQPRSKNVDIFINFGDITRLVKNPNSKEDDRPGYRIINNKSGNRRTQVKIPQNPFAGNQKPPGGDIVVFPDSYNQVKFTPIPSKCTKSKGTLCESFDDDYPAEYISQLLKREGPTFLEFFGEDKLSEEISERINYAEETTLCPSRHEVIYPKAAKNTENKWLFIVNQDKYLQGIAVEVCINPGQSCDFTAGFPVGYVPTCKQRFIERKLVALGESGKTISDSFYIPSCCVCVVNNSGLGSQKREFSSTNQESTTIKL